MFSYSLNNNYRVVLFVVTYSCVNIFLSSCISPKCRSSGKIQIKAFTENKLGRSRVVLRNTSFRLHTVVLNSDPIIQKVIDIHKLENSEQELLKTEEFRKHYKISLIEEEKIILISYEDFNSRLSKAIVNTIMETYIDFNIRSNGSVTAFENSVSVPAIPKLEKEPKPKQTQLTPEERKAAIQKYWREVENMNQDAPQELKLGKYQSHDAKIVELANSSCS